MNRETIKAPAGSDTFVESFAKGLAIIRAFDGATGTLTLSEAARRTQLTRAGARRLLHTLVTLGYASHDDGRFALTPRVLDLGHAYLSSLSLSELAQPVVEALAAEPGVVCALTVLDGDDVVYVARAEVRSPLERGIGLGSRLPAFVTSMGRVLLAALDPTDAQRRLKQVKRMAYTRRTLTSLDALMRELARIRELGYSVVAEELELGVVGVAMPVVDGSGRTVAAINMSTNLRRETAAQVVARFLPKLREGVAQVSRALGGRA